MAAPHPPRPLPDSDDPTLATFVVDRSAWPDLLPALAAHLCAGHKLVVLVPPTDTSGLAEQWLAALDRLPRPPGTQIGGRALEDRLWDGAPPAPLGEGDGTTVAWVEHDLLGYRALLAGQAGRKHFYVVG